MKIRSAVTAIWGLPAQEVRSHTINLVCSRLTRPLRTTPDSNLQPGEDRYHALRRETIRADLVRRLRAVCAHLSDDDFSGLVDVMVERQLKGERRKSLG